MWISRKTFVRSSRDSSADGERGTWTLVLTDSGLFTYAKGMLIRQHGEGGVWFDICKLTKTHNKSVKLAKGLQPCIISYLGWVSTNGSRHRRRWSSRARRKLVRHGAG
jgi:hypothetical protein